MSGSRTVIKNTGAMLLGTVVRMSASFILVIFIGRKLGPTGMGEFSIILTLFWIFQTMASMGIQPLIIREVAKDRKKTGIILTNASILSCLVSLFMAGAMIGFGHLMGYSMAIQQASLWMGAALIIATISLVFQSVFIAWEKAELVLISMTWENIIRMSAGIFVLFKGGGVVEIAGVFALASLVNLAVNVWLTIKKITDLHLKTDIKVCFWLARLIPAFAGISIFSTLFWHMDMLLLSRLVSMEEVGYYSAPMRLVTVIKLVLQSYKIAIQPVAARLFLVSREEFKAFCEKSLFYVFIFSVPICVGGFILSDKILLFIFGDAFTQSSMIFQIVVWIIIPYGIMLVFASFLIASHHQNVDLRINLISMISAYVLGYIFISQAGAIGAGLAVFCSILLFMMQQFIFIFRHMFKINFWQLTYKIILSAIVMGGTIRLLHNFHVIICVATGVCVYFVMLAVLNVFSVKDIQYLIRLKR